MTIFSEDTEITRSVLAMIASYLASLLEAGKAKRMASSIISPVEALSYNPSPTPICRVYSGSANWSCLILFPIKKFLLRSLQISAPLMLGEVYTEYRTHSVQSSTEPSALIDWAYV